MAPRQLLTVLALVCAVASFVVTGFPLLALAVVLVCIAQLIGAGG